MLMMTQERIDFFSTSTFALSTESVAGSGSVSAQEADSMSRQFKSNDKSVDDPSHLRKDFDYRPIHYAGDFVKAYERRKIEVRISVILFGDNVHSHFIFRVAPVAPNEWAVWQPCPLSS
jgi:hypothetical protein